MTIEEVTELLAGAGETIVSQTRLPNDTGDQLYLSCRAKVNVFDTGTVNVQGNQAEAERIRQILGIDNTARKARRARAPAVEAARKVSRNIFVVYGHDQAARTRLEAMLRRWKLEPIILDQLPSEGQTLIEKLEHYTSEHDVSYAVVLATPDDEGYPVGKVDERRFRARQNVVLELGLLLGKLGRARVAILLKDQDKMERPSDIQGLIYIPFTDDVEEAKVTLAKEMEKQGFTFTMARL